MIEEYILWHDANNEDDKDYVPFSSMLVKRDSLVKGFRLSDYEGLYYKLVFNAPVSDIEIQNIISVVVPSLQQRDKLDAHVLNATLIENDILHARFYDTNYFELLNDTQLDTSVYFDVTSHTYLKASEINPIYRYTTKCGTRFRYSSPNTEFTVCEVSKACVCLDQSSVQCSQAYSGVIHHHLFVHLLLKINGEAVQDTFLLREECDLIDVETVGSSIDLPSLQKLLGSQNLNVAEYMYFIGKLHQEQPSLVGINEFAKILGWTSARVSTLYSRQFNGKNVRNPLPIPLQILASTPIWTSNQAFEYKARLENKSK